MLVKLQLLVGTKFEIGFKHQQQKHARLIKRLNAHVLVIICVAMKYLRDEMS